MQRKDKAAASGQIAARGHGQGGTGGGATVVMEGVGGCNAECRVRTCYFELQVPGNGGTWAPSVADLAEVVPSSTCYVAAAIVWATCFPGSCQLEEFGEPFCFRFVVYIHV